MSNSWQGGPYIICHAGEYAMYTAHASHVTVTPDNTVVFDDISIKFTSDDAQDYFLEETNLTPQQLGELIVNDLAMYFLEGITSELFEDWRYEIPQLKSSMPTEPE